MPYTTDTYGRSWEWPPIHDMSQALEISRATFDFGFGADLRLSAPHHSHNTRLWTEHDEPYLLKTSGGWLLYIRVGEHALDTIGPLDLDPRVVSLMLDMHKAELETMDNASPAERHAYSTLAGADGRCAVNATNKALWDAITYLERQGATYEERIAAADGLRALVGTPVPFSGGSRAEAFNNPNFFWYVLRDDAVLAGFDVKASATSFVMHTSTTGALRILHRSDLARQYPEYAAKEPK